MLSPSPPADRHQLHIVGLDSSVYSTDPGYFFVVHSVYIYTYIYLYILGVRKQMCTHKDNLSVFGPPFSLISI